MASALIRVSPDDALLYALTWASVGLAVSLTVLLTAFLLSFLRGADRHDPTVRSIAGLLAGLDMMAVILALGRLEAVAGRAVALSGARVFALGLLLVAVAHQYRTMVEARRETRRVADRDRE